MIEDATYHISLQQMRQERSAAIAADDSWLTLAGLHWLQEGENSFGTAEGNLFVLPEGMAPPHAGSFTFADGTTTVYAAAGVPLQINGKPVSTQEVHHDMSGSPDRVTLGALTMIVIKRGARYGIRLFDNSSPRRQSFTDLDWFAIDPMYCIEARFVPYGPAKPITYGNVLGELVEEESPGYIDFVVDGVDCRLDALPRGDKLFFNFRDVTNGETTYGAGRFLYTDAPQDGHVIVDFNQATNPYCAYTDHATCPLPPAQNRLTVRIAAGERRFTLPAHFIAPPTES